MKTNKHALELSENSLRVMLRAVNSRLYYLYIVKNDDSDEIQVLRDCRDAILDILRPQTPNKD